MAKGDTKVWDDLVKRLTAEKSHVKIGIIGSEGGNETRDGISMIELGAIHEFGSPAANIPERSFIRRTFIEKEKELGKVCELAVQQVFHGAPVDKVLAKVGAWGANQVKRTITDGTGLAASGGGFPGEPLKQATIDAKGSDRPLVDTGRLLGAITWKVEKE